MTMQKSTINNDSGPPAIIWWVCFAMVLAAGLALPAAEPGKTAPAVVSKPGKETDLSKVTLTPEAEKRLGITTAVVERRKIDRTRIFGGEVILPPRRDTNAATTAQATGKVDTLISILPSMTPAELIRLAETQIDADGQVERARVQLAAAKIALERGENLVRNKAGSARLAEEAKVQVQLAEATLQTAQARRHLLGAPLMDIMKQKSLWVRVPVYVGDLSRLQVNQEARVGGLSDGPAAATRPARPVPAPPSANPAAATVDLFYEVPNEDAGLRLGQKVGVIIPLTEKEESLVVPWSAVVNDINGGAWVYESPGQHVFVRRRVQVRYVVGNEAALASGPKPGTKVVTTGVAELFGTEFGVGK